MSKEGWYVCKFCRQKLFPIKPDTLVRNLDFKCKNCKSVFIIDIEPKMSANTPEREVNPEHKEPSKT